MPSLPVSTPSFWRDRLRVADQREVLHHSVYICGEELWKKINRVHREILAREIDPSMRVLDAGCGYGRMADVCQNYTGVDISPDLLARARETFPSARFVEGDLTALSFRDKEFDIAFCVSIRAMIVGNSGESAWAPIAKELQRVAKKVILLEYEEPDVYNIL